MVDSPAKRSTDEAVEILNKMVETVTAKKDTVETVEILNKMVETVKAKKDAAETVEVLNDSMKNIKIEQDAEKSTDNNAGEGMKNNPNVYIPNQFQVNDFIDRALSYVTRAKIGM